MTTKTLPFKGKYDLVNTLDKYSTIVLYVSTIIVIWIFVVRNLTETLKTEIDFISKANCILIIGYLITQFLKQFLLFNVRRKKNLDLIDNAFGTAMTSDHSEGYYSNENIEPSIYKLAVNGFENVLFSLNISQAMLPSLIFKNAIILFVFLSSTIYGFNNILVLIIQLALPAVMLQQIVRLLILNNHLEIIYLKYCSIFNDLKGNKKDSKKLPEMIYNIVEYEAIISWSNILLSENKFNEMNPILSEKWEKIKIDYGINV